MKNRSVQLWFIKEEIRSKKDFVDISVTGAASSIQLQDGQLAYDISRAGHFRYFSIFSIIKNDIFAFFIKLKTYFCTIHI